MSLCLSLPGSTSPPHYRLSAPASLAQPDSWLTLTPTRHLPEVFHGAREPSDAAWSPVPTFSALSLGPGALGASCCALLPDQMPVSSPFMGSLMAQVTIMTIPGFPGRSPNPCPLHQIRTWPIHSCKVPTLGRCQNTMGKFFPFRLISPTPISVYSPAPQTHCPREATCIAFALFENYLRDYKHKHPFELCVITSRRTGLHICYSQLNSSF